MEAGSPTKAKEAVAEESAAVPDADSKDNIPEEAGEPDMKDLVVKDDIDEPQVEEDPINEVAVKQETAVAASDSNMDNEDSLNLTIGEDEAQLLQGEVDHVESAPIDNTPSGDREGATNDTSTGNNPSKATDAAKAANESPKAAEDDG